jgi:hypothetical protein
VRWQIFEGLYAISESEVGEGWWEVVERVGEILTNSKVSEVRREFV